ncbi:MAG: rhodanese-like domain-containing protein [Candidatus Marinamargulisbacteria bacterium]
MNSISVTELHSTMQQGDVNVVDVRTTTEFKRSFIEGALNIPTEVVLNHQNVFKRDPVYVICNSGNRSRMVIHELAREGITNVINVEGGIQAWLHQQLPVSGVPSKVIPMMRQVMIVAGLMILSGVLLHFYVNPKGIFLSGFVGLGLFYAGASGNCYMTKLLALLPWNK